MITLADYQNRLKQSLSYAEPHWERFEENYRHYFSKLTVPKRATQDEEVVERKYPFASQVTSGISFDVVETILPRLIGRDPEFITAAFEPEDVPAERIAKLVLENQYHNPKLAFLGEPIYIKLQRLVKEQLICGTAVGRPFWRRQSYNRSRYKARFEETGKEFSDLDKAEEYANRHNLKMKFSKYYEETPLLDDFDLKHIPFFFFLPDPFFCDTGRMRYKIERDFYTADELIAEAQMYGYDKEAMKKALSQKGGFTPDIGKNFFWDYNESMGGVNPQAFSTDDARIPLYLVDKMWSQGRVYVFVNEEIMLTPPNGIPSPYDLFQDPFIFSYNVLVPHSFYGRSEIDAIKRMEDAVNDLTNMRSDNLFDAMSRIWFVNNNLFEDKGEDFAPIPNSVWQVKDINNAAREVRGQDVSAAVYKETEALVSQIQKITGVTDYAKGAEGIQLAGRTYGGLRLAQEVANLRFLIKSTQFETITLRALGYFILEMSRQFFDEERLVRVVGQESLKGDTLFEKIKPIDLKKIRGFMDIQVIPSSTRAVDEQAEAMKLNSLLDRMMTQRPPFDRMNSELYNRFLLKYLPLFGFQDALYWVRVMNNMEKEQKQEMEKAKEKAASQAPTQNMPVGNAPVMTSTGVQEQPNPLEQILANQTGLGNQVAAQANSIPLENIINQ